MAVEHIQETDTLNLGRGKINKAIDLANDSSDKVDQFGVDLDQGIKDAKKIATDAGSEAKTIADTAGTEAKQAASVAAAEAKTIATNAGNEAKSIAETAGKEANKKADQAIADSATAVGNSNQAIGRANQNKQEFDALQNEFDDLVAQSGDSTPEIVQSRTDTSGVKQSTLQNRLTSDFNARLTSADAIGLFSGPIDVSKMMDMSAKVAGNLSSNPNVYFTDYTATSLKKPSATWAEVSQENYNKLANRDDQGISLGSTQASVIPQGLGKLDTVKTLELLAPRIFEGMTSAEKVKYVKDNFISFTVTTRGKASSPNNKNLKVALYMESTDSYTTKIQGDATEFTDFTTEINDSNFIDKDGFIWVLSYTDSANGVTSSNLNTDYLGVNLLVSLNPLTVLNKSGFVNEIDLEKKVDKTDFDTFEARRDNPHEVSASQVGSYSVEKADEVFATKLDLTKDKVGLGNVDNFSTASQIDAEEGDASDRFMTVLRTKQQIDKRLATDAEVIAAEEPTKLITPKNLKSYYNDRQKIAVAKYGLSDVTLTAKGKVSDASWRYRRVGNEVEFFGRFNFNAATDIVNVHALPTGFRLSADFDDTSWNVPLVVTKAANPTSFLASGFVERMGTNLLRVGCNASGNTYWYGRWYTDDPFPNG